MASSDHDPDDRHHYTPRHVGPNIFPNFFFFSRLVRLAHKTHLIAVRDVTFNYTATYQQLLTDVLHFRNVLYSTFSEDVRRKLDNDEEVYVNLLGPGGYEFTVAFFALMALGAAIVPISVDIPVKEATYFATKSKSVGLVTAAKCLKLGLELQDVQTASSGIGFPCIQVTPHLMRPMLKTTEFLVSSDKYWDLNKPGSVIFTSGTTGPPKGGVKRRGFFYDVAAMFADQFEMREGDTVLHVLPVHHATGVTLTLLPFLLAGATVEFRSGGFDVAWTWERIKQRDLDFFSGVPTIYMRLMHFYEKKLKTLPASKRTQYDQGARRIRAMLCGTSALPRPLQDKWTKLRGGSPILTRYGATEFGNAYSTSPWMKDVPDGSVGPKNPCVDMKLTSDPEGEVLMKGSIMFSKYLYDKEATTNALDKDGYFKTGDIARREGDHYFILGRASVDILKSGGYKISALDVEREILGLDYISEVMVVGVEDEEFGQRVAAAIVLKEEKETLTLEELRKDLNSSMARYKMPTLLRLVPELRKNATGKVIKKVLGPEYFPVGGHEDVQKWQTGQTKQSRL